MTFHFTVAEIIAKSQTGQSTEVATVYEVPTPVNIFTIIPTLQA